MPWKRTNAMTERAKLVLEWERRWNETEGRRGDVDELARLFGVRRQTAYVWIRRYEQAGHDVAALEEGSRRPRHHPKTTSETTQDFLVEARKAHPRWGPRYPLTIVDAYSRYLIRCEALDEPNGPNTQRVFDSAFQQHGLLERFGPITVRRSHRRDRRA
jgi:transposase-like protein